MPAAPREEALPLELSDEPLVGWRCWFVLPHEVLLRPIYRRGLAWKPREPLEAICPNDPHEVPADGCKCGVWTVCHPMLLDEVGWTTAPPQGIGKLPGVIVVGEVALWGKIIQHERGWRAGFAYPRHLYAFTDDPMIAETLRERYGVPVEWGVDAERLRRFLPAQDAENEEEKEASPSLCEALLDVLRTGLCPKELERLAAAALDDHADYYRRPPAERIEQARAEMAKAATALALRHARWLLSSAVADVRTLGGNTESARRVLWARLVHWQRVRGTRLINEKIEPHLRRRDELVEDLTRGTSRSGQHRGQPYAASTLYARRSQLETVEGWIAQLVPEIEKLLAVPIPTYREWCALARGIPSAITKSLATSEVLREWHQRAMRHQAWIAEHQRAVALERARLIRDRETCEERQRIATAKLLEDREALAQERTQLRENVVDGVKRDHDKLLVEVGELEQRRRAALAMLPGPWPPPDPRSHLKPAGSSWPLVTAPRTDLRERMRALGITLARVAEAAGCTQSNVSTALSGRSKSRRVIETAEAVIARAEADFAARGEVIPPSIEPAIPAGPGRLGIAHPALTERLRQAGISHAQVAAAATCSRALVASVLSGHTAERRGLTATIVPVAERLLAETTGQVVDGVAAREARPLRSVPIMREALLRERAELDDLRHRMLAEREETKAARRALEHKQRQLDAESKKIARAAEAARLRHITAGLARRLEKAGISRTQLAHAARCHLSNVCRLLAGYGTSERVVEVAERLLARAQRRRSSHRSRKAKGK